MKYYNIVTPKKYYSKEGEEKTKWLPVGTMRETDDGKRFIEWNATPEVVYLVTEQKSTRESEPEESAD